MARTDYLTAPQVMILTTGCYLLFIAWESVLCYYIAKWNSFNQRRHVSALRLPRPAHPAPVVGRWEAPPPPPVVKGCYERSGAR